MAAVTDAASGTTQFSYTGAGKPAAVSDPGSQVTSFAGRLSAISDGSGSTTFGYDGAGRLVSATDPAGKRTTFAYAVPTAVTLRRVVARRMARGF